MVGYPAFLSSITQNGLSFKGVTIQATVTHIHCGLSGNGRAKKSKGRDATYPITAGATHMGGGGALSKLVGIV